MHSKLFNTRCYLIGAMDRVKDGGVGWRRQIIPKLNKLGVIVFDPTNKPTRGIGIEDSKNRDRISNLKKRGKYDEASDLAKPIRTMDLRMVDTSDFIICNLDIDVHACGTYEELFLANREKKPILIHVEQGKTNVPHWLLATIPHQHIFDSWTELLDYLSRVANGKDTKDYKRWIFFDMTLPTEQMMKEYGQIA